MSRKHYKVEPVPTPPRLSKEEYGGDNLDIVQVLAVAALLFIVWYGGVVMGYLAAQRQTRKDAQQLLDAWAAETGGPRIRLNWDGDGHDPDKR